MRRLTVKRSLNTTSQCRLIRRQCQPVGVARLALDRLLHAANNDGALRRTQPQLEPSANDRAQRPDVNAVPTCSAIVRLWRLRKHKRIIRQGDTPTVAKRMPASLVGSRFIMRCGSTKRSAIARRWRIGAKSWPSFDKSRQLWT
jgi:hypothetical protein